MRGGRGAAEVHVVLLILVLRGPEDQQNRKLQSGALLGLPWGLGRV